MLTSIGKLIESDCAIEKQHKVCRSRGGESCAFDGAMIVLQPIADAAHIVHGPIACCGNSWEGRGTLSSKGSLHKMGFTTDMSEMDIIYGSEEKLYRAILEADQKTKPNAIFVYTTCVSGLIGEDIEAICRRAQAETNRPVIPVNSPGFVGPKNLGNRIAGEVLLEHVIGKGKPAYTTDYDINLVGEYNIAGDLWLVEPLLKEAGVRVLSHITGDATFEEITHAHHAKLNVVVCSRALINVAREMERIYGIPYIEVSFFGKTETSKALRMIAAGLAEQTQNQEVIFKTESLIKREEAKLARKLTKYSNLKGKRAVLYTGGVKSWSVISALHDIGIGVAAVGTKKSTFEDEEKMRAILGDSAPLVEDVTAKNLLKLMKQGGAEILVAGGRNQYLAMKEGLPFVDVNQERHTAYAGYAGLVNLAEQISGSVKFFKYQSAPASATAAKIRKVKSASKRRKEQQKDIIINPLKHSPAIGAAMALQGVHNALPIMHSAQGCGFLGKVLLTKHFREPIALANSKLFTEDVVMGSDETLARVTKSFVDKNSPDVVAILSSGLSEVKGDDVAAAVKELDSQNTKTRIIAVPTPDYAGSLEGGYALAVEALLGLTGKVHLAFQRSGTAVTSRPGNASGAASTTNATNSARAKKQINVLIGPHLTPADFSELRDIIESFDLIPVILPDLSALDGSRKDFTALTSGGTRVSDIKGMGLSVYTLAIGTSMEPAAKRLSDKFGITYQVLESISGLKDSDVLMHTLSHISGNQMPDRYKRQRRILVDGMRDAHFYYIDKKACVALEGDLATQVARWLFEVGAEVDLASDLLTGDKAAEGDFDLLIASSHGEEMAKQMNVPLYEMGFPVYKTLGYNSKVTIGYRGTLTLVNEVANLLNRH